MEKNKLYRTDMADEWSIDKKTTGQHIKKTKVIVDKHISKSIGKPLGAYITVQADAVVDGNKAKYRDVVHALKDSLYELGCMDNCLVVGLGNAYLTADALGNKVVKDLIVTRHIHKELDATMGCLSAITPSVFGVTGIESFDIIAGVIERTKPSCIIAVDSLASATVARLATAFQVSDAGITPGSGVGNGRMTLNKSSLGCPVYSIGVPLVVFATTIINDILGDQITHDTQNKIKEINDLILTPKDIDILVESCAKIISQAINLAVHKGLDIDQLAHFV